MTLYLSMDGVDDTLFTYLTFTSIIIDMSPDKLGSGDFANYINAGSASFSKLYSNDTWSGFNAVYKDELAQTKGTPFVSNNVRAIYQINSPTPITTNVFIFNSSFNDLMKGKIYDIQFYNGATLVAHYDMSKGNVLDQSGNGKNATLNGGTFIDDAPPTGGIVLGEASISASGNISGNASVIVSGSSSISADGSITATSTLIVGASTIISADSSMTGNGSLILNGQATISASSSITADAETSAITRIVEAEATISADSSVDATATLLLGGTASISASSSSTATGYLIITSGASISAETNALADGMVFDPSKQIIKKIQLNGQRELTTKLEGNQELKVSLLASRDLTIKLEGGIMATVRQNFSIYAGDSKEIVVTVKKEDGTALNLSGSSVKWGFDNVVKTTGSGITLTNATGGEFTIKLSPVDTQSKSGIVSHGGNVTDAAGNVSTVIVGEITINKSVI